MNLWHHCQAQILIFQSSDGAGKIPRLESFEVARPLADPDEMHRKLEFLGDRDELAAVDTAIDQLDDNILRSRETHPLQTLAVLRRRIASLCSALASHRPTIQGLVSPDFSVHVGDIDGQQFEKPRQIFERIEDKVARSREVIVGSFDLYTARVTQDTNQLVKALTLATVIIGVIGAVAGVFGMNFDTPISHTGLPGFLAVTGILIFLSIAIITVGFWQKWL